MIEITYPDNSKAQYHENGDNVKIIKTKYLTGGQHVEYKKDTIAKIANDTQIYSHPLLAFLNTIPKESDTKVSVPSADMISLEKPRLSFTQEEAQKVILSYDDNNLIKVDYK